MMDTPVGKRSKSLYHAIKKKMGLVEDVVVIVRRVKKIKKKMGKSFNQHQSTANQPHNVCVVFLSFFSFVFLLIDYHLIYTYSLVLLLIHSINFIEDKVKIVVEAGKERVRSNSISLVESTGATLMRTIKSNQTLSQMGKIILLPSLD